MANKYIMNKSSRPGRTSRKGTVKGNNGIELTDQQTIRERWKQYTEDLYANRLDNYNEVIEDHEPVELEPDILEEEVIWAVKHLPNYKAPGIDRIPAELLKPLSTAVLTALCNRVWRTCSWPKDWKRSVFIPIPKKGDTRECINYRTIALIPHASKILLKIIQQRINRILDIELPDVQAGFRKGRGTRDHLGNLCWLMEETREYQKAVYMCFIDYTKAFDCVDHSKLWESLQLLGVPNHLIKIIKALYFDQEATVRTTYGDTDWFNIQKGVHQGCILSPLLFNLYAEIIMRNANLDCSNIGVKIGGRNINNLRYADDTTLLAESEKDLQELIQIVKVESEKMGLHLNIKKTQIMTTAENMHLNIKINNTEIEIVKEFIFLGSKVHCSGESGPEIKRRLALGRSAMINMDKIWRSKDISTATKCRIVEAIVFPIATYGCESWTVKKADRRKIDAFELWCWRKLLRIPWTARVTNKEVLESIKPRTSLEGKITKLRLAFFGHVMRANSLEKAIMLGMLNGKRRPGRQRMRWLDIIETDTNMTINQLKEAVLDRKSWRVLIHRVSESRPRLNG